MAVCVWWTFVPVMQTRNDRETVETSIHQCLWRTDTHQSTARSSEAPVLKGSSQLISSQFRSLGWLFFFFPFCLFFSTKVWIINKKADCRGEEERRNEGGGKNPLKLAWSKAVGGFVCCWVFWVPHWWPQRPALMMSLMDSSFTSTSRVRELWEVRPSLVVQTVHPVLVDWNGRKSDSTWKKNQNNIPRSSVLSINKQLKPFNLIPDFCIWTDGEFIQSMKKCLLKIKKLKFHISQSWTF